MAPWPFLAQLPFHRQNWLTYAFWCLLDSLAAHHPFPICPGANSPICNFVDPVGNARLSAWVRRIVVKQMAMA
jgi:hypothetical protein